MVVKPVSERSPPAMYVGTKASEMTAEECLKNLKNVNIFHGFKITYAKR